MVRIRRLVEPSILTEKREEWVDRWRRILTGETSGEWATPTAKEAMREVLLRMSHGKCAYCEGTVGLTGPVEIEHYVHKKRGPWDPALALEWANLLPACQACNNAKRDVLHGGELAKPDEEDPEPLFWLNVENGELEPHPKLD
jgi:uncharacterized protein (TIGR02646 family)